MEEVEVDGFFRSSPGACDCCCGGFVWLGRLRVLGCCEEGTPRRAARLVWAGVQTEFTPSTCQLPGSEVVREREMRCRQGWAKRTSRTGREPSCSWALATSIPVVRQTLVLDVDDAGGRSATALAACGLQSAGAGPPASGVGGFRCWIRQDAPHLQVWLLLMVGGGNQAKPGLALNILSARGQCRMGSAPVRSVITKPQIASPDRPAFQYRATLAFQPSNPPCLITRVSRLRLPDHAHIPFPHHLGTGHGTSTAGWQGGGGNTAPPDSPDTIPTLPTRETVGCEAPSAALAVRCRYRCRCDIFVSYLTWLPFLQIY
jgi:hypothetical protein